MVSDHPNSTQNSELFPNKLYDALVSAEQTGDDDIVSFLPHGRAFKILKQERFVKEVMPKFFGDQTKWSSFSRQLNLYGFLKVTWGKDAGAYYHELFLKGKPNLINYMRRVGVPKGFDRRRYKLPNGEDPDFYRMPPLHVDVPSNNNSNSTSYFEQSTHGFASGYLGCSGT